MVWIGGSILASTDHFENSCVTVEDWEERGAKVIHENFGNER